MPDRDARAVFRRIYDTAHWGGGSGQGSRADVTSEYRSIVERLLRASDVRTVVDAGCGDWEFARLVDWSHVTYVGIDIVPEVIEQNRDSFSTPNIDFACDDVRDGQLPRADLLLCKDVLQHWPVASVQTFLTSVTRRCRYTLITNDITSVHCPADSLNSEVEIGAWRTVDLEAAPFARTADWRRDYDIRGEWTKRVLLLVRPRYRMVAKLRPRSGLNLLRR